MGRHTRQTTRIPPSATSRIWLFSTVDAGPSSTRASARSEEHRQIVVSFSHARPNHRAIGLHRPRPFALHTHPQNSAVIQTGGGSPHTLKPLPRPHVPCARLSVGYRAISWTGRAIVRVSPSSGIDPSACTTDAGPKLGIRHREGRHPSATNVWHRPVCALHPNGRRFHLGVGHDIGDRIARL